MEQICCFSKMIWILYLFPLTWKSSLSVCRSLKGNTCCFGYYWNEETSTCEDCPLGYHNINCTDICTFPSFGKDCQGTCNCSSELCDHKFGCIKFQAGSSIKSTSYTHHSTSDLIKATMPIFMKDASSKPPTLIEGLSNIVIYSLFALIGVLIMLCGVCVGTYFYRHCIKHSFSNSSKGNKYVLEKQDGYNDLEMNKHEQNDNSSEQAYLEPVSDVILQYQEIIDIEETDKPFASKPIGQNQFEQFALSKLLSITQHSQNCEFSWKSKDSASSGSERKLFISNSL